MVVSRLWHKLAMAVGVTLLTIVVIMPFVWMGFLAFRPENRMFDLPWQPPFEFTWSNLRAVFTPEFYKAITNSIMVAVGSAILSLFIGCPAGFALARWRFRTKGVLLWLVLLLRMAPPVGFVLPLFLVYLKFGLIDTRIGLMMAYLTFTLPLVIWLMWMFFSEIPPELFEAALVDGASVWQSFLKIGLPLSRPGLLASGVLAFGAGWNDFFFALVLTRAKASTGTVAVVNFLKYSSYDWGGVASACLILIIPAIPIAFFMQKYLVQGFAGALKG